MISFSSFVDEMVKIAAPMDTTSDEYKRWYGEDPPGRSNRMKSAPSSFDRPASTTAQTSSRGRYAPKRSGFLGSKATGNIRRRGTSMSRNAFSKTLYPEAGASAGKRLIGFLGRALA